MSNISGKFYQFIVLVLQILCMLNFVSSGPSTDYCTITCRKGKHTVCARWHKCGPVAGCYPMETTVEFRNHMVKEHNRYRNDIASGFVAGNYANKGAKNMNAVSYDLEMEYIAQCWANVCRTLEHDKCRSSKRFAGGQNIFWGRNANETKAAVKDWFDEIQYMTNGNWFDKFDPKNYPQDGKQRGHFTQLVWAKTKYIGCARVRYGRDKKETQLICNYGPAGNMIGESIYKRAQVPTDIGSECKTGTNSEYKHLCGQIDPIPVERAWAGVGRLEMDFVLAYPLFFIFWLLFK